MSEPAPADGLRGRRILVTRPAGQNEPLAALIRAAGGEPIVFPVIEILALDDGRALAAAVDRLDAYDLAVFISPNAVDRALSAILARRTWPQRLRAATVGPGSERSLRRYGVTDVVAPSGRFDSEALLDLPALAGVGGQRVVIFRGLGGREVLGDALRGRGAAVDEVECYRRARPRVDAGPLAQAGARGEIDAVTVSSSEGLGNLFDMLGAGGEAWLKRTPLFAPHARIAERARALGCERVIETAPGEQGIVAALAAFWAKMSPP